MQYIQIILFPLDVIISESMHFNYGRCHTLRPLKPLQRATRNDGYSIMLTHHLNGTEEYTNYDGATPIGWHIFIHDKRENFTGK